MEIMLKLGKLRKIFPREIFDVRVLLRAPSLTVKFSSYDQI